ncbi:MAG: hypothetical protein ACTS8W_02520, partial [Arsenophonus sp. NC-PY1-MAG3]
MKLINNLLKEVYGSECLSWARVFEWFKHFQGGQQDVEDDLRPGRPTTSKTDDNVKKVANLIRIDRQLSICAVAETVGIDKECVRQILRDNPTNVAETSLTVPGIKYVIDTGYVRISRYSYHRKVQRLPIE